MPEEQKDLSRTRVLVVDDRLPMRTIIRNILEHLGIRSIDVAANGEEAWAKLNPVKGSEEWKRLQERPFELVISDWVMPVMDGMELLSKVRRDKALASLPFLMLTSQNDRNSVVAAGSIGADDYIIKPFSSHVLEQKVLSLLKS